MGKPRELVGRLRRALLQQTRLPNLGEEAECRLRLDPEPRETRSRLVAGGHSITAVGGRDGRRETRVANAPLLRGGCRACVIRVNPLPALFERCAARAAYAPVSPDSPAACCRAST